MLGALLLGLLTGLNVALIAMGAVLIFKAGKYINFAQAQLGTIPMIILGKLVLDWHISWYIAIFVAISLGVLIAMMSELLVIRPLARLGPETVLVATLGISQLLIGLAYVNQLGASSRELIAIGYPVPFDVHFQVDDAPIFAQHILTIIVVPAVSFLLWLFLQRTLTGKSIRAAASNEEAARLAGLDIGRLSLIAWSIAGALATVGSILDAPNNPSFNPQSIGPQLMFSALGAAAIAGFSSFPQAAAAAVYLSLVEAVVVHETSNSTEGTLAIFLAVVVAVLVRRPSILRRLGVGIGSLVTLRPGFTPAFRATPLGRVSALVTPMVWVLVSVVGFLVYQDNQVKLLRINQIFAVCIVAASVSLLAGLTGLISLGQFAFASIGGIVTGQLLLHGSQSLLVDLLVSAIVAGLVAVLVVGPFARGGSVLTAVATLGFGVMASAWLFGSSTLRWIEGLFGHPSRRRHGPGLTLPGVGPITSSKSVFALLIVATGLLVLIASLLQRSWLGKTVMAVRFNRLGSQSLGLPVALVRSVGIAAAGAMAGAAGCLQVVVSSVSAGGGGGPSQSLLIVSFVVIGGVGSLSGAVLVTLVLFGLPTFFPGLISQFGGDANEIELILASIILIAVLRFRPGGLAAIGATGIERLLRAWRPPPATVSFVLPDADAAARPRRSARFRGPALEVRHLSHSFGVVRALSDVSVVVGENEIVGLIGNNGAGKTTLLNCVAGDLTGHDAIRILGRRVSSMSASRRARLGIGRTFQDANLFDGLTTREVIELAARNSVGTGTGSRAGWNRSGSVRRRASEVIDTLRLAPYQHTPTSELPTGVRRLVELAIQLVRRPQLLLLDEPTAGLSPIEVELFAPLLQVVVAELGCSVLMIEHNLALMLDVADRIYCLELGNVIAEGTPAQIRADPAVIESYFGAVTGSGGTTLSPPIGSVRADHG